LGKKKMNKNYVKGRKKEYKIMKEYKENGWVCLRSAGSHGFADVIAIHPTQKIVHFIQAKPNGYSLKEIDKLEKENKWVNDIFKCHFLVM
jgi:Holliday junction resolvase